MDSPEGKEAAQQLPQGPRLSWLPSLLFFSLSLLNHIGSNWLTCPFPVAEKTGKAVLFKQQRTVGKPPIFPMVEEWLLKLLCIHGLDNYATH